MQLFRGLQIAVDLGLSLNFKKKSELRKAITDNGGTISYIVTKKCHIVITSDPEKCDISSKCRMALKYGLPVLKLDYIWDCLAVCKLQPYDAYVVGGKATSLDFKSGKISAGKVGSHIKEKKRGRSAYFNPHNLRVWKENDPAQPEYDEKLHEVVKYSLWTWFNPAADCEFSYIVELHAKSQVHSEVEDSNKLENAPTGTECFPYRVFFQSGSTSSIKARRQCQCESRYTSTAEQALDVYAMLVDGVAKKPGAQICRSPVRGLGSTLLQRKMAEAVQVHEGCSDKVQDLVEHVWKEAMTEVTSLLGRVTSIKLDQVEKADAILSKISSALQTSQCDEDIHKAVKEFYTSLNHKNESLESVLETKISWKKWLVKKRDLCQLVKDIVSVSEMTNYESQAVVEAKYAALRCRITAVSGGEREEIEKLVMSNISDGSKLRIINVFEVWRQVEDVDFRHDLQPKKLLFHSSRVENFVGILSRGLLLPKVVVDEYGGTRSDAGMLGSGIYFASASSTSVKYSAPSNTKGTRLLLINEVALGTTKDYIEHDKTLMSAPNGYDSTHGVGRDQDNKSQFEVHEYVVYKTNQQRIRYLVEFATVDDIPQSLDIATQDDTYISSDAVKNETKRDFSLHDVLDVTDPMEKVEAGLVSSGDQEVELKGVHIRAKLVDLAGEVVVLQEYYNNSSEAIEAKYVFPLGEAAAVCGFEAFINGKHVVGEVKEKETAHKEYKKAISEGHGAYLMDQDEETPDVFTVSVGNLPAGACVLIKITYVTELKVEEEKISFRLPGTVAPWKEKSALLQTTQNELKSHATKAMKTSVQVAVDMPFDIRTLHCPTHKVKIKQTASKAFVQLAGQQEFGSGFLLLIGLAEIHVPRMWVEQHPAKTDHQACMLTFYPEFELEALLDGEIIIILDMSNSMKGTQILKLALLVLKSIPNGFKFNIIRFGSDFEELFPAPKLTSDETIELARLFVESSNMSMGSTNVRSALRPFYLLPPGDASSSSKIRNMFLLSDGHLVEEGLVLEEAAKFSWHTRIFTFGVSPTCNNHTLRALARVSAGAFEYFDPKTKSKWQPKVKSQVVKAMQPGLTSVSVEWRQYDDNPPPPVQAPRLITALFSGSQQIIYGYVPNCTMANLKAVVGGQEVSTVVSTSELSITEGLLVHRLTARAIIQDWETGVLDRDRTHHELTKMELKDYVIDLSKEYSIVTQLTSFVAIEKREENEKETLPKGPTMMELLDRENVENLPYMGWTFIPESSIESLIEELSFKDEGEELETLRKERAEKTAELEKLYLAQSGRMEPCTLENLQTLAVIIDNYKSLGEVDKAQRMIVQALKDASPDVDQLKATASYPTIAAVLANLRGQLPEDIKVSEVAGVVIPWPEEGNGIIKVKTLTGKIREFSCRPDMSIKQLKDLIYGLEGYPQDIQRLIYNGKQVQDSSTLSDCGADFGAVFHLVQRLRGGGDAQDLPKVSSRDHFNFYHSRQDSEDDDIYEELAYELFEELPALSACNFYAPEVRLRSATERKKKKKDNEKEEEFGFGLFDDDGTYDDFDSIYESVRAGKKDGVRLQKPTRLSFYCDHLKGNEKEEEFGFGLFDDDGTYGAPEVVGRSFSADLEALGSPEYNVIGEEPVNDLFELCAEKEAPSSSVPLPFGSLAVNNFSKQIMHNKIRGAVSKEVYSDEDKIHQAKIESSEIRDSQPAVSIGFGFASTGGADFEIESMGELRSQSAFGFARPGRKAPQPTLGSNVFGVPAQKLAFGSAMFGGPAPQQRSGSALFGGTVQQPESGSAIFEMPAQQLGFGSAMFGTPAPQSAVGSSMFGAPAPQSAVGSSMFGAPAPQSASGSSMIEAQAQQSVVRSSMFGAPAPQSTVASSMFGAPAPQSTVGSSMFGASVPQSAVESSMFGAPVPQSVVESSMFGAPAPQSASVSAMVGEPVTQPTVRSTVRFFCPPKNRSRRQPPQPPAAMPCSERQPGMPPPLPPKHLTPSKVQSPPPPPPRPRSISFYQSLSSKPMASKVAVGSLREIWSDVLQEMQSKLKRGHAIKSNNEDMSTSNYLFSSPAYSPTSPVYSPRFSYSLSASSEHVLPMKPDSITLSTVTEQIAPEPQKKGLGKKTIKKFRDTVLNNAVSFKDTTRRETKVYAPCITQKSTGGPILPAKFGNEGSKSTLEKQIEPLCEPVLMCERAQERDRSRGIESKGKKVRGEILCEYDKVQKEMYKMIPLTTPAHKRLGEAVATGVETSVPQKKLCQEVSLFSFGIGTDLSPARVGHSVKLCEETIARLFELQKEDGSWQFGEQLDDLIGVNSNKCIGVLRTSGLSSLGLKAWEEITRLLATILAMFSLLKKLLPEFSAQKHSLWTDVRDRLKFLCMGDAQEMFVKRFSDIMRALNFLIIMDKKYPVLYSRLELGSSWFNVAVNLMGPAGIVAA
ncbi:hypothetical protein RRG08_023253 [Elysia crispata]|uniref:Poly [ADP-ribose] polymerase n=1 Tax=Elysia crispata TaxID=231223 RepID=A0AAE0ZQU8_9GAST|nr:hypothetical protein RRG08_023253 [Elysia crispata]